MEHTREKLSSRLGFIFLSAGCAIGLGNIWRFPYITGRYGGGAFVLIYLFFLIVLGIPVVVMEYSIGRKSQRSIARAFDVLEKKGQKWHLFSYAAMAGNYLLVMFYTTISGWMLAYFLKMVSGSFAGLDQAGVADTFSALQQDPIQSVLFMAAIILIGIVICSLGLQNGVERITKIMMTCLLAVMLLLVVRSVTLPNALEGLKFYLIPDFDKLREAGIYNAIYAAMGQACFTLSAGMGGMMIFGSYLDKKRTLGGEALNVMLLDTFVAITAGLIIFPACFAYGVPADQGPGLVFVTLPNIFNAMPLGTLWGSLFFIFMNFAAITTIVAVFENIMAFSMDLFHWTRKRACIVNFVLITLLSIPCALGFSILSGIQPFGAGSAILDLEDFLVSNVIMPLGAVLIILFCTTKRGWGWQHFIEEANTGKGFHFPQWTRFYISYILPCAVLFIFIMGIIDKFA